MADGSEDAERKEPDEGGAAAEILRVLAVECAGVAGGVVRARVRLGASGTAATRTTPGQSLPFTREAEAMAENLTPQHWQRV
jgi:hypothetical protein